MNVTLSVLSAPRNVAAGRDFTVVVAVSNNESTALDSAGPTPLRLSYHWRQPAEESEPLRTSFWRPVAPGATEAFDVRVQTPIKAGPAELVITLVRERVRWYDYGSNPIVAPFTVVIVPVGGSIPFDIQRYERSRRSQNGEDGILAELLLRVGWLDRFIVEFGAADGFECNSATLIEEYGWGGLLIESDKFAFQRLRERFGDHPNLVLRHLKVNLENVAEIFADAGVAQEFDVLSIDIDGNDYWLWRALRQYRPRIVVIEYNAVYPPPQRWVMAYEPEYEWGGTSHHGASLASLAELGRELGYALIGTDGRGVNAFFVREDVARSAMLVARDPADVYTSPAIRHAFLEGPFVEM